MIEKVQQWEALAAEHDVSTPSARPPYASPFILIMQVSTPYLLIVVL